jgi:integrase
MAIVKHKSDNWYFRFAYKGRVHFGSCKTPNKVLAMQIESKKRQEVIREVEFGERKDVTLADAADEFLKSIEHTKQYVHHQSTVKKILGQSYDNKTHVVVPCFGLDSSRHIHTLKDRDIQLLVNARHKENFSDSTILAELGVVSLILQFAKRMHYRVPEINIREVKKANRLKQSNARLHFLSQQEEADLLVQLHPDTYVNGLSRGNPEFMKERRQDLYDFAITLLDTGARYSEISKMSWRQIDLTKGTISLYRPKVKNESILTMTNRLKAVIERRAQDKKGLFVFLNKSGHGARNYTPTGFRAACRRAGLDGVSYHTLRHTFASRLVQHGVSLFAVQQLLGHTTPIMTNRYAHLAPNQASIVAVNVLNNLASAKDDGKVVHLKISGSDLIGQEAPLT